MAAEVVLALDRAPDLVPVTTTPAKARNLARVRSLVPATGLVLVAALALVLVLEPFLVARAA